MKLRSEQEMLEFGKAVAAKCPNIIELIGDVGAGKTTFVRGLAKKLGVKENITSPSFTISKSYALPDGGRLIHYDFYRLSDPGLMIDDLTEVLQDPQNITILEWPDTVSSFLPEDRFIIQIEYNETGGRNLFLQHHNDDLKLYLDTSTPETILKLNDQEYRHVFANDLAEKLLSFIRDKLAENGKTWQDISEITFMSGPGSFTGLRIGASIVNTLASELNIPLYDHEGKRHQIILPIYDRPANISKPKK